MALLHKHGALVATREDALDWATKAKTALNALPAHDVRDMLRDIADYVVARIS